MSRFSSSRKRQGSRRSGRLATRHSAYIQKAAACCILIVPAFAATPANGPAFNSTPKAVPAPVRARDDSYPPGPGLSSLFSANEIVSADHGDPSHLVATEGSDSVTDFDDNEPSSTSEPHDDNTLGNRDGPLSSQPDITQPSLFSADGINGFGSFVSNNKQFGQTPTGSPGSSEGPLQSNGGVSDETIDPTTSHSGASAPPANYAPFTGSAPDNDIGADDALPNNQPPFGNPPENNNPPPHSDPVVGTDPPANNDPPLQVPEPLTFSLVGIGLAATLVVRRRTKRP